MTSPRRPCQKRKPTSISPNSSGTKANQLAMKNGKGIMTSEDNGSTQQSMHSSREKLHIGYTVCVCMALANKMQCILTKCNAFCSALLWVGSNGETNKQEATISQQRKKKRFVLMNFPHIRMSKYTR
jgi:hypothetical protein